MLGENVIGEAKRGGKLFIFFE